MQFSLKPTNQPATQAANQTTSQPPTYKLVPNIKMFTIKIQFNVVYIDRENKESDY